MKLARRILRFLHPEDEAERMKLRHTISRALAEAEDVTRTVKLDGDRLREWLRTRVHVHGRKYAQDTLIMNATGEKLKRKQSQQQQ